MGISKIAGEYFQVNLFLKIQWSFIGSLARNDAKGFRDWQGAELYSIETPLSLPIIPYPM
jgi:hypothetical protein